MGERSAKNFRGTSAAGRPVLAVLLLAVLLLAAGLAAGAGRPAYAAGGALPQIWMGATEPVWRAAHGWPPNDYMELFQPNAPWQYAARYVRVFQVSKRFVEQTSDRDLARVIAGLKRRGILLAMQGTPNLPTHGCGRGIESYGPPDDMARDAARIRALGGTLSYIMMDEPLFFGHVFPGRGRLIACHAPIATIAADAARKIAEARGVFPAVQVGETEPFGIPSLSAGEWASMLRQWFRAFKSATGRPLAFLHADIVWLRPDAIGQFEAALPVIRAAGIPLGVIYDGTPADPTGAAWVADAKAHVALIERKLGIVPAQAVFQTWMDMPTRMLPDTAENSLTGLVASFVKSH